MLFLPFTNQNPRDKNLFIGREFGKKMVHLEEYIPLWPLDSPAWSSWPFGNLNLKEIKTFDSIDHNIACITDTLYL